MTWWELEAPPPERLLPLDQLAELDGRVVALRVTPRHVLLTEGGPGERTRRPLVVRRVTHYARAGRTLLATEDGERLELLFLGERETAGVAVGDPESRLLRGRRRGAAGALATVPRGLAAATLVTAARSVGLSRDRNEARDEFTRRVVASDPDAAVAQI